MSALRPYIVARGLAQLNRSITLCGWQSPVMSARGYAGQAHRLAQGRPRSGNESGPLTDEVDWEFADGTQPPPSKAQQKRVRAQALEEQRLLTLLSEMDELRSSSDI
jgi:Mitoribosomal protein mL52